MSGPLLILGASEDQLPLYREARRRGLTVIGADRRHDRPARPLADIYLDVSIRDATAVAAALGGIRPAAVVTAASDAGLRSWHDLCEIYATPYRYPLRAAEVSADKAAFRRLCDGLGLPGYRWAAADRLDDLAGLPFPLVVKPNDGSGSKGLTRVDEASQLAGAFAHAAAFSPVVIAEELVPGRHFALEVFLSAGRPLLAAVTEKRFVHGYLVGAHHCPADLPGSVRAEMTAAAVQLCAEMGLRDGPANFDAVRTPDGRTVLIEVNARLGGNGLPALLRAAHGADTVGALISLVLGEPVVLRTDADRHATLTMFGSPLPVDGRLTEVTGLAEARRVPGVLSAEVFPSPGEIVRPFTQSGHKIGQILATGATPGDADRATAAALAALTTNAAPFLERESDARA